MSGSNGYYVPHETKWPFLNTVALIVLFIGLANYMNGYASGMSIMFTGLAPVSYTHLTLPTSDLV